MDKRRRLAQQSSDAEARWQRLGQRLAALREARDLETRIEERLRLDSVIAETQKSQAAAAAEMEELEAQQLQNDAASHPLKATARLGAQSASAASALQLFAAYAPQDELQVLELDKHLAPLRQSGLVSHCYRPPFPGESLAAHQERTYQAATIILVFVSADFLSTECSDIVNRATNERRLVIPILLRPADWKNTTLGHLACLPADGSTISEARNKDQAWQLVIKGLRSMISRPSNEFDPASENIPK